MENKFDIITFGSATWDVFLKLEEGSFEIKENFLKKGKRISLPLGNKAFVENLFSAIGGGGVNTAVSFKAQGFNCAYAGKIGGDKRGDKVISELKKYGVDTKFIKKSTTYPTIYSTILSPLGEDRTILIYEGASHFLDEDDIDFSKINADWFYIAPLNGESSKVFEKIVEEGKEKNVKIAANLGRTQIEKGLNELSYLLKDIDILILNEAEASLLSGIARRKRRRIMEKIQKETGNIVVLTLGDEGSWVADGEHLFKAETLEKKVKELTGAGDAYAAGFVGGFIRTGQIEKAIQRGTKNAISCIQKVGATCGFVKEGDWENWPDVKIKL